MIVPYLYALPGCLPKASNAIDRVTLAGIELWEAPLIDRYTLTPQHLGWAFQLDIGSDVVSPASMTVLSWGYADTTGGVLMSDASGHVRIYVSGLTEVDVFSGQVLAAGSTPIGKSNGRVFFQIAYLNRVFDPSTLSKF